MQGTLQAQCIRDGGCACHQLLRRSLKQTELKGYIGNHIFSALSRGHPAQQLPIAVEHTDPCRANNLMTGEHVEIRIQLGHIHSEVRHGLGTIHQHHGPLAVGDAHHLLNGWHGSQRVGDRGERRQLGAEGEQTLIDLQEECWNCRGDKSAPSSRSPSLAFMWWPRYPATSAAWHEFVLARSGNTCAPEPARSWKLHRAERRTAEGEEQRARGKEERNGLGGAIPAWKPGVPHSGSRTAPTVVAQPGQVRKGGKQGRTADHRFWRRQRPAPAMAGSTPRAFGAKEKASSFQNQVVSSSGSSDVGTRLIGCNHWPWSTLWARPDSLLLISSIS